MVQIHVVVLYVSWNLQRHLPATVEVVELALGHGVVDVDGWDFEVAQFVHLKEGEIKKKSF